MSEGGRMSEQGQPLFRLNIPNIQTLISRSTETEGGALSTVEIASMIANQNFTPLPVEQAPGIIIDTSIPGRPSVPEAGPVITSQTVGRVLPRTFDEVQRSLSLITPTRAGKKNPAYTLSELKIIAQNLSLPSSGVNKESLANLIIRKVTEYYNGS